MGHSAGACVSRFSASCYSAQSYGDEEVAESDTHWSQSTLQNLPRPRGALMSHMAGEPQWGGWGPGEQPELSLATRGIWPAKASAVSKALSHTEQGPFFISTEHSCSRTCTSEHTPLAQDAGFSLTGTFLQASHQPSAHLQTALPFISFPSTPSHSPVVWWDKIMGTPVSCFHYEVTGHLEFPPRIGPPSHLCWDRIAPLGAAETFNFYREHRRECVFPLTSMTGAAADKEHQEDPYGSSTPSYDSHYRGHLVPLILQEGKWHGRADVPSSAVTLLVLNLEEKSGILTQKE